MSEFQSDPKSLKEALYALRELTDEIVTYSVGRETVTTVDDVKIWLSTLAGTKFDGFVEFVNE